MASKYYFSNLFTFRNLTFFNDFSKKKIQNCTKIAAFNSVKIAVSCYQDISRIGNWLLIIAAEIFSVSEICQFS